MKLFRYAGLMQLQHPEISSEDAIKMAVKECLTDKEFEDTLRLFDITESEYYEDMVNSYEKVKAEGKI